MTTNTNKNKILKGVIVSDKMDKSVVVVVTRFVKHPKYQKYMKITKKFKAHDENNSAKVGEIVGLRQTRPMSKDKSYEVIKTVNE